MSAVQLSSNHWLADHLCDLLASPHISLPSRGGLFLGPGPVDLFTTRFNNCFAPDATGEVGGHEVDREGLKEALLMLQQHWNSENIHIMKSPENECLLTHTKMSAEFEWTPKDIGHSELMEADAEVRKLGGTDRISFLCLHGDEALFRV